MDVLMKSLSTSTEHQNSVEEKKKDLLKIASELESMMWSMVLKNMRDSLSVFNSELSSGSAIETYHSLYDQEISKAVSKKENQEGSLKDALIKQLSRHAISPNTPTTFPEKKTIEFPAVISRKIPENFSEKNALDHPKISESNVSSSFNPEPIPVYENLKKNLAFGPVSQNEAFVLNLWKDAKESAERLGIDPKMLLAQTALETGWGRKVMQKEDQESSYNLFSIKSTKNWKGETVLKKTLEFEAGLPKKENAFFKAYKSFSESFHDFCELMEGTRFRSLLEEPFSAEKFVNGLQKMGYATDPDYAKKILKIYKSDVFDKIIQKHHLV